MQEEKHINNTKWLVAGKDSDIHFKIKPINDKESIIWVRRQWNDLGIVLELYDFTYNRDEWDVNIEVDATWNKHMGFKVANNDLDTALYDIFEYILMYNIKASSSSVYNFTEKEWNEE